MSRIIFQPQYPSSMRYSSWWFWMFPDIFHNYFDEVVILGEDSAFDNEEYDKKMFSPINASIKFETEQIKHYMSLDKRVDDILFLSDISFPGIFQSALYLDRFPGKIYAFCHAGPLTLYDIFEPVRVPKFTAETAFASMCEKVFVGSHYYKEKVGWSNMEVVRLPKPPLSIVSRRFFDKRIYDVIAVARPCIQKWDTDLEIKINEEEEISEVKRFHGESWDAYCDALSSSKTLLIMSKDDTFNYTIIDAIICGCVPVAPNRLCFPEILPREYLYDDHDEAIEIITNVINGKLKVPVMLCDHEVNHFFENIIQIMKESV